MNNTPVLYHMRMIRSNLNYCGQTHRNMGVLPALHFSFTSSIACMRPTQSHRPTYTAPMHGTTCTPCERLSYWSCLFGISHRQSQRLGWWKREPQNLHTHMHAMPCSNDLHHHQHQASGISYTDYSAMLEFWRRALSSNKLTSNWLDTKWPYQPLKKLSTTVTHKFWYYYQLLACQNIRANFW